jgi:hypothetical protein
MIQKKIHRPECWIENKTSRFEPAQIIDHEPKMAHTEEDTKEDTNHEDCEDGSIPHWIDLYIHTVLTLDCMYLCMYQCINV